MIFILPLPETTNHIYRTSGNRWYKSSKAKAWEEEAGWIIKRMGTGYTIREDIYIGIDLFLKFDRDIDGSIKPILDTLQRHNIFKNDSQVKHLNVKKYKDTLHPRVEIDVQTMK